MRQARRSKKHYGLFITAIIIIVLVAGGAAYLIHRASDVQGPAQPASSSVSSTKKTKTLALGTYTAEGTATDATGNTQAVRVYLKLRSAHRFTRQIIYDETKVPLVTMDSGTFKHISDQLTLSSNRAITFAFPNTKAYGDNTPNQITTYGTSSQSDTRYPQSIQDVLNNAVDLKKERPNSYQYLDSRFALKKTSHDLPSLSAYLADQDVVKPEKESSSSASSFTASSSSKPSSSSDSDSSSTDSSSSSTAAGFVPSKNQIQLGRQQLQDIGVDDSKFTDAQISAAIVSSANRGGDSVVPILAPDYKGGTTADQARAANVGTGEVKYADQAYAILLQKYPASAYSAVQTGLTSDASGFVFSVTDNKTGTSKSVTVTGDGQVK